MVGVDRRVIVAIDPAGRGRRAVGTARDLAVRLGAGVRLVTVAREGDDRARIETTLEGIAAPIGEPATDFRVIVAGDVAGALVEAAGEENILTIATAASLRPHAGHFGSVAEDVVRRMARSVSLVGPRADPTLTRDLGRIILPVDGSARSRKALGPAAAIARLLDLPVWVVTVLSEEDQRASSVGMGGDAAAGESGHVRSLAARLSRDHGVDGEFDVLHGRHPADAIIDFARHDGIVVMSTHGRTGLARLFAGSVTTSVVARSEHPVFVVHAV